MAETEGQAPRARGRASEGSKRVSISDRRYQLTSGLQLDYERQKARDVVFADP